MNELEAQLADLGIDEKQAKVYLACLELGASTVQELAEKSGVKRTSIYNFLDDMKAQGLLTEVTQGNRVLLIPEDPHVLVKRAEQRVKKVTDLLPDLMGIFNQPGHKPKVRYYEGVKGLEGIYEDILHTKESPIYAFSDYEKMFQSMDEEIMWGFAKRRAAQKLRFLCITKAGPEGDRVKELDEEQVRETRFVKDIDLDTDINIYGNKVALLSFRRPYAGVIIEDNAIAKSMKGIWKLVWNSLE